MISLNYLLILVSLTPSSARLCTGPQFRANISLVPGDSVELDCSLPSCPPPSPPRPSVWSLRPGWTRYSPHGSPVAVDVPLERCLVLDVEVAVKEDPRAVMATAVSDQAWYSWLSPHLTDNKPFQRSPVVRIYHHINC